MTIREMIDAVNAAENDINRVNSLTNQMAGLCAGRLRKGAVSCDTLASLKRELRDYNIHTGGWKIES